MFPRPPSYRRLLLVLWLATAPAIGSNIQDVTQLEALAGTEAARQLPPLSDKQRMQVGPIAPGLQFPRCASGVTAAVAPGLQVRGRVLIELHCADAKAWQLYVPVRIVATSTVAVAAHAIVVGTVLTAKDLAVERRDATELPPGYLDDPSIAVGLTAARPISEGAILTNQQLLGTKAVQRGQTVTLIADAGGISVRMAGRAMSDGLINQRIKVENLSSGKIVEGIARSEQVVEIVFE
jgi:flagella basal body P-ring formation protein FlgA